MGGTSAPGPRHVDVTLLFTDIEGSTRLWEADEATMSTVLARHDALIAEGIADAGGVVFKTVGDAFCAAFADAASAVEAAVSIQRALQRERWPDHTQIRVRMGLHSGRCEQRSGDYFGAAVNRAARLHAIAHGEQVIVSERTAQQLASVPSVSGAQLHDLGQHRLKDLREPERVFQVCAEGLRQDFPALRSLDNPALRHNLPKRASRLVGRERELAQATALVAPGELLTLTGAGGVGKTSFALQVAAELLDGSGDGVWFVDLSVVSDSDRVAPAALDVLGVQQDGRTPALERLGEALRERELLLVLDNCEHVIDGASGVAERVLTMCPSVALLATSREPLRVRNERVYRMPSLSLPDAGADLARLQESDAVRLFAERATQHLIDFQLEQSNAWAVASICRRVDGIPLAIELATPWLRALSVEEVARRLEDGFELLAGGNRTDLPRQQTLTALIDWSYDRLSDVEQRVFERLCVFAGTFDLDAAEAVCADAANDGASPLMVLASLVDKSLVQAEYGVGVVRYRLLETIRAYATAKLHARGGIAAARTAHRDHFLTMAEFAAGQLRGHDQVTWLDRLDQEQANLQAALDWCLAEDDPVPGLRLAAALTWFWRLRGSTVVGARELQHQLDRPRSAVPDVVRARALAGEVFLLSLFDVERCIVRATELRTLGAALGDRGLQAEAALSLGVARTRQGRLEEGRALNDDALALARFVGDVQLIARCLLNRMAAVGPHEAAAAGLEALELLDRAGDRMLTTMVENNIGYIDLGHGDTANARLRFERAVRAARELQFPAVVALSCTNLGLAEYTDGRHDVSATLFGEAVEIADRLDDLSALAYGLLGAALAADVRDAASSAELHGAADALFDQLGTQPEAFEARLREGSRDRVTSALGQAGFNAAYAKGRSLSRKEATATAVRG